MKRRCSAQLGVLAGAISLVVSSAALGEAATIGMVADDATKTAVVFDADTLDVIGAVPLGGGTFVGDCDITPDLTIGVVTDYDNQVWVVDLTTAPPSIAAGLNPVAMTNPGEDVSITSDGQHAVVCDATSLVPVSVVDIHMRTEVEAFDLGHSCNAVDVCPDGSVLVGSYDAGVVRRLRIDGGGRLSDTADALDLPFAINVHCAADSVSGVGVRFSPGRIQSFTIPGLVPVNDRPITTSAGITGGISTDGSTVMARSANGVVDLYGYDAATAALSAVPRRRIATPTAAAALGIDQAVLHPDGSRVFVPAAGAVNVYSSVDGSMVGSITAPEIVAPLGVCVRGRAAAECGNGVVDGDEACDDGELNGTGEGTCLEDCGAVQTCGDGVAQGSEACDDGASNGTGEGACVDDCSGVQVCGDGEVQGIEACDQGAAGGFGEGRCLHDCSGVQRCGDGRAEGTEVCDDGAASAACDADCTLPVCGDAETNAAAGEECDDGTANSDTAADACRSDCTLPLCGDAALDSRELCEVWVEGAEVCNNQIDDDGDGAIDCVDGDCPSVCSHDPSITCSSHLECRRHAPRSSASHCIGAITCGAGCTPAATCARAMVDVGSLRRARRGDATGELDLYTMFEPQMPGDLESQPVSLLVTDADGVVFFSELLAGDLEPVERARASAYGFDDDGARIGAGRRGGIGRVRIREHRWRGGLAYGVRVRIHADLSAAAPGPMSVQIVIGDDSVIVDGEWVRVRGGMRLRPWR